MIKVSVIIAVYNAQEYIEKCAKSLMEQTLDNVELIFINDASTDSSVEILENVLSTNPREDISVKIIHNHTNKGIAHVRQQGIDAARGKYTIHCDSDDWVEPSWLELLYNEAERINADLVSCNYTKEENNCSTIVPQPCANISPEKYRVGMTDDICGSCWNKLIRTSIFQNKISFVDGINYQEDLLFAYKVLCHCQIVGHIDKSLYHYNRTHSDSLTWSHFNHIKEKFIIKSLIDSYETNDSVRKAYKLTLCKDFEIRELWIARDVSNREFNELFSPFRDSLKNRNELGFVWKFLASSMYFGFGGIFRNIYRKLKK